MDAKLKAKWIRALRSGSYRRGEDVLVSQDGKKFCCLGVLADIQGCIWQVSDRDDNLVPIAPSGRTPFALDGASYLDERAAGGLTWDQQNEAARMNDEGASFKRIAAFIKANF